MMGAVLLPLGGVVFGVCLAGLAYADIRWGLLPDRLVALLAATAVIPWLGGQGSGMEALGGSGCGACLLWLLRWLSRGGLGWGDVKLIAAVSLHLGADIFRSLIIACILCLGYAVWKKESLPAEIPFAPFLCIGFMLYAGAG